jgi:hypothetical protein
MKSGGSQSPARRPGFMSARHQAPEALIVDRQDRSRWRWLALRDPHYAPGTRFPLVRPGPGRQPPPWVIVSARPPGAGKPLTWPEGWWWPEPPAGWTPHADGSRSRAPARTGALRAAEVTNG